MTPGNLNPACLPTGTQVGSWRVVDLRGRGTYGTVYLVKGVPPEASGFAALKLAMAPRDERFAREVTLLSRIQHPNVPRLLEAGQWQSQPELPHPYIIMELIEGIPLYVWAQARVPSSRQVLRVLAGLARALEATHAAGGVHRDVKGGNVLVRLSDDHAFLMDFGCGTYADATPVTWQALPPGTPAYRAPEAFRAVTPIGRAPARPYSPGPLDDLFALGVTAWRLVTGKYPATADTMDEGCHIWQEGGTGPQPAHELNTRCSLELSALISRMLSLRPEARGTARELADALEQASVKAGPEADAPLFLPNVPEPMEVETEAESPPERVVPPAPEPRWNWWPWLAAASIAGPLVLGAIKAWRAFPREHPAMALASESEEARDAGVVGVGDSILTAPVTPHRVPSTWSTIGLDLPSKPLRGQTRPDASGRCPSSLHVPINGGCWIETKKAPKDCLKDGYVYKGGCYVPAAPLPPPSTSTPPESRDGG